MSTPKSLVELRVLDGPNVHLNHPAIQVRLDGRKLLDAPTDDMSAWAEEAGLDIDDQTGVGEPDTARRAAVAQRWLVAVARELAARDGFRGLHAVAGPGYDSGELIVAFPWSSERRASKLGEWVAWCVDDVGTQPLAETFDEGEWRLRRTESGPRPRVPDPVVPTVGITGTNGKTTTTRLIAFLAMACGRRVAWNSTDGIYASNESLDGGLLVEQGDWAGFGGARRVLDREGVQTAVIEVARGGLLRRGMGVRSLDVGVVTNVSADHMGEMGIHTLDQLARVKGTVARAVREDGWAVLNAEDARVIAMRHDIDAAVIAFSIDPDARPLAEVLADGGRVVTVIDGDIVLREGDGEPRRLISLEAVPITLAGLSRHNLANALAGTAAAWGLGLSMKKVARGLHAFVPDADRNPGRLNCYVIGTGEDGRHDDERLVLVDIAHNEDSMRALCEVGRGLTREGARLHVILGSIGDRTEEIMVEMGQVAGSFGDTVTIAEKNTYLRGRNAEEVVTMLRAGALKAGATDVAAYSDEMAALDGVLAAAAAGDVVTFPVHVNLARITELMAARGAVPASGKDIARWAGRAARSND